MNQLKLNCDTIEQLQDLIETSAMFKKSKSVRVNYVGMDDPFHNFKEYSSYDTFEACETLELEYQPPGQNVFYILKMFPNIKEVSLMMKNLSLESPQNLEERYFIEKFELVAFNFANKHALFSDDFKISTSRPLKELNINLYKATLAASNVFSFLA